MNKDGILVALWTIVRKEVTRFLRVWTQTLLPSVITSVLYFVIFGSFVGSQVKPICSGTHCFTYMQFIVPGLVMMAVITNAYTNVVSSFFQNKFMRNIDELLVSPTPTWVILLGYSLGGVLRGLLVGALVLGISLFFTKLVVSSIFLVFLFILLTSVVFSLAGLTNGILARKFDDVAIVPTFVLTPLTYLGGVFYSVNALSPFWQGVSKLNPILYMVNGFRYGFLGVSDVNIWFSAGMLVLATFILTYINWSFINRGKGLKN